MQRTNQNTGVADSRFPAQVRRVVSWAAHGYDPRALWLQHVLVALAIAGAVTLAGPLEALALFAGAALCALLLFGPSRLILSVFIVYMVASHQYISVMSFPFAGVEWHPRELLFFLLLAHAGVKLLQAKVALYPIPMNLAMLSYAAFFLLILLVGLLHRHDTAKIIAEVRFGIFVACYFILVSLLNDKKDVWFIFRVLTVLTLCIALAGLCFVAFAMATGNRYQLFQTMVGEVMTPAIGPVTVQIIRPNGHMYFEIGLVIACAYLVSPRISLIQRANCLFIILVLGAAILATYMRTAYVTVFVSLMVLAFLHLPSKRLAVVTALVGIMGGVMVLALFGAGFHDQIAAVAPGLDLSLKGRLVEISGAWRTFLQHPAFGSGMGSTFEGLGLVQSGDQLAAGVASYQFVHNVWMYYLFKGGIFGLALVLFAAFGMLFRGYYLIDVSADAREKAMLRGLTAALAGQFVAALAMPRLTYPNGHVMLALLCWAIAIMGRELTSVKGLAVLSAENGS